MGTHRYLSYTCQSCGNRATISGWDQSKIPRCPTCTRATCTKCGAGNFCNTCTSFIDAADAKTLRSLATQARMSGGLGCLPALACIGTLIGFIMMISRNSYGIATFAIMLSSLIAFGIWSGVAKAKWNEKERTIVPLVMQRIQEARGGLEDLVNATVSRIMNGQCPQCGGPTTQSYVVDKATGRPLRSCSACGILL